MTIRVSVYVIGFEFELGFFVSYVSIVMASCCFHQDSLLESDFTSLRLC